MPNINRVFTGGLNLDDHPYRLPENAYLDSLNITRDSQGEGQDGVVANILGNVSVSNSLPSGTNKVIGGLADKLRNRYYFFNWNSNGNNGIYYYSQDTGVVTKILVSKTDSGGIDILNFNPSYKIYGVNLIYRDDIEGDLLYFNDGLNEPRVINTVRTYTTWLEEYISVAKAPPIMPLKPVYENDTSDTIINTTVLDVTKVGASNIFEGGIQTDFGSFDNISSTLFTTNVGKTEFTYIGVPTVNLKLNLSLLLSYNFPSGSVIVSVLKNGIAVTGSEQTINAGFGGVSYVKSLDFPISTNDIIKVQFASTVPFSYPSQYFIFSSGSMLGVTQSVSSNARVTVNNLRNSLFQFRYRYVYDDFEKSVWSSASVVPLPNQPTGQLTQDTYTNNARISLSFSTGGAQVSGIEIAFRRFSKGVTTDWQLIDKLNKSDLSILDNDIYTYKFYNDGIYNTIDILDTEKLQDYVPQLANAAELLNGNTLIYGGITEGYDELKSELTVLSSQNTGGFFYDYNGLLFFAAINGNDSGSQGTTMKVFLYGTGTNDTTTSEVVTLNNGKATFVINAIDGSGNGIGASVTGTDTLVVSTALGSISAALVSNGWTQSSLSGNVLTMTFPTTVTLLSSGTKLIAGTVNDATTSLANVFEGACQIGVLYFDSKGRTNGVITNVTATYNTPKNSGVNYCQPQITIKHRPPTWATYYQIVRSNNTTYNKRLFWISDSAYSNTISAVATQQFAYIGINNIAYYNEEIKATEGVVNYSFTEGDRIRFLQRYTSAGAATSITVVDYEVLGVETDPNIGGSIKQGTFVKIYYPTNDISGTFKFDGTADFQNYEILLYNYTQQGTVKNKLFYEFGKCFGIGNAGTANAYHIGLNQTQSATNPSITPALIDIVNGDLFFRKRTRPVGLNYAFPSGAYTQTDSPANPAIYATCAVTVAGSPVVTPNFTSASQVVQTAGLGAAEYPTNFDNDCVFNNTSSSDITIRVRGKIPITTNKASSFSLFAKFAYSGGVSSQQIFAPLPLMSTTEVYEAELDVKIKVPANNKLFLLTKMGVSETTLTIGYFDLKINVLNDITIPIIESSFSDVYNIVTNSNGREAIVDENAKRTYFPTLVRFSQSYQADTNINGVNRFFFENQDTYDRGFGDIQRLHVRDRYMKVYQKFKVGNVPVLTQIVKDVAGNPLQANTDQLINKIQYYSGDYGIGDCPCSLAWDNFADYFVDDFRGVVCRLSQDGITPISIMYKTNSFFVKNLKAYRDSLNNGIAASGQVYTGNPTVYGTFDAFTNKYIVALEEINRYSAPNTLSFHQDPYTLAFDEVMNQWESFYSYHPEWLGVLNTLLLSFKNGGLWRHNSTTYCNFYGTQYDAYIEAVFNNGGNLKKTWISLTEFANTVWDCPEISSQLNTYGTTAQSSRIPASNFKVLENNYHSNFLRDINSSGGLANGNSLKGNYLTIKFRKQNASQFYYINLVSVNFIDSPLNKQ